MTSKLDDKKVRIITYNDDDTDINNIPADQLKSHPYVVELQEALKQATSFQTASSLPKEEHQRQEREPFLEIIIPGDKLAILFKTLVGPSGEKTGLYLTVDTENMQVVNIETHAARLKK